VPFNSINMALDLLLEEEGHNLSASGNETLRMSIQVKILYDCIKCFLLSKFDFHLSVVCRDEDNYGRYIRLCQD
jgi:hypothetical protein